MTAVQSVAVLGAGATGAYLAAQMTRTGVPTTVVARGESLEHIRAHGIIIEGPDGQRETYRPDCVCSPGEQTDPVDLVLFCVKSYDTESAVQLVSPLLTESGRVLCLQNGVRNEQVLAEGVGHETVLSGVLYIGADRPEPGFVSCSSLPSVIVGPYGGNDLGPSSSVQELFVDAGIKCTVEPDVSASKWQKFLFNCGLNPITAITGRRLGELLAEPTSAHVFHTLVDEAAAAALSAGAPLPPDHRDKVNEVAERMKHLSSSMAEDLAAGRGLEIDAFTGYVIALGQRNAISTPTTQAVHGLLTALTHSR